MPIQSSSKPQNSNTAKFELRASIGIEPVLDFGDFNTRPVRTHQPITIPERRHANQTHCARRNRREVSGRRAADAQTRYRGENVGPNDPSNLPEYKKSGTNR
eukprot:9015707-Pyramimonas_sp.AAC.1